VFFRMVGEDAPLRVPSMRPVAVLVLDCGRHLFPVEYGIANASAVRRRAIRALQRFDLVVAVSNATRETLVSELAVDPAKIVVAPCALPLHSPIAPEPPSVALRKPFFLLVNPGGGNKNWTTAFEAYTQYARSRGAGPLPRLVVAGGLAAEESRIRAVVASDPVLHSAVDVLGHVSDTELAWLYTNAHVLLAPSLHEGFGLTLLEAMSHDLPVLASSIPAHAEVADGAALLVEPRRADKFAAGLERVDSDHALRSALIARGHTRVRAYSWRRSAEVLLPRLLALGR
jgi:glycosyltransferase involved in cell wall biosynthesis